METSEELVPVFPMIIEEVEATRDEPKHQDMGDLRGEGSLRECKPLRIYIASPYAPRGARTAHEAVFIAAKNVDRAIRAAIELIEKGHYPYVPHWTHYLHTHPYCPRDYGAEWYYNYDLTFLELWAEAVLVLGDSRGVRLEVEKAKELGLPIYYSIDQVPEVMSSGSDSRVDE